MEKAQNSVNSSHDRFNYQSDEGLKKILKPKIIQLHSAPIISEQVREFVRERIDFQLTDTQWLVIDKAMAEYWNMREPGTWICNEDMAAIIFLRCDKARLLISWDRILQITNQIWEYLVLKGRLTDK
jgi:hypothetical protein